MKKEVRKCAVCGKKFTPKTANALVCSDKCYKARKADLDKKRKLAKKAEKKPSKPDVKKVEKVAKVSAKKPLKAKAVEKIVLPKKPVKKVEKAAKKPVMPKGCNTLVDIKAGDDFKVCALALFVAFSAIARLCKNGKIRPCK